MKNIFITGMLFFSLSSSHAQSIRCFGDSFTEGLGAYFWDAYPYRLNQILNYPVQNHGVGGQTSAQILTILKNDSAHKNYPTIIWAGYNDANYGRFTNDVQQAVANIQSAVNSLGHQRFLVISVINNCSRPKGSPAYDYTIALNAQLQALYSTRFVDVRDSMVHYQNDSLSIANDIPNQSLMWDCVHSNGAGYNYVAQKVSTYAAILFANPLPLTFTNVSAAQKNNGTLVIWNVATENNVNHYEVERSIDGISFDKVTAIPAKNNNGTSASYQWLDAPQGTGTNYYRIKSVDNSGAIKYSSVVKINLNKSIQSLSIYPNPVKDFLITTIVSKTEENAVVKIYNSTGAIVKTLNQHLVSGTNNFSVDVKNLPVGMYLLEYNREVSRFIK